MAEDIDPGLLAKLVRMFAGEQKSVETPQGELSYREGGFPGAMANIVGGTANMPGVGPISSSPMSAASVSHETAHGDRGAISDLMEMIKGHTTPSGEAAAFWRPSETYAYSSQPAHDPSQPGGLDLDLKRVGTTLLDKPDLLEYYLQYRNPKSDWPTSLEGFRELGLVNSDEALERARSGRR